MPDRLRVIRKRYAQLSQSGDLRKKVQFAKVQSVNNGSHATVFVVDTEGKKPKATLDEMRAGRDSRYPEAPMAIGVAHPCIEAWLLADVDAIANATGFQAPINVPQEPEKLPAPQKNRVRNPKTILAESVGQSGHLPAELTTKIARILDLARVAITCPQSFAPFAEEVRSHILPLFDPPSGDKMVHAEPPA